VPPPVSRAQAISNRLPAVKGVAMDIAAQAVALEAGIMPRQSAPRAPDICRCHL
jgi:hypothetical protein